AGRTFTLEEEYIAGWLAFFPATHLTPYVGIQAVPPSTFVRISGGKQTVRKYWDFDPGQRIRYRSDAEYEEHFRSVFRESVKRRLRSDTPVLAELSGGMDSSSIVCMADKIIEEGCAETPRLDTVSYYDDREPNWNERPYFTKVEEKRGRTGCHIEVGSEDALQFKLQNDRFAATPGALASDNEGSRQFAACMSSGKNRVVLSGIGGDEILGGVPTPVPELADLLVRARFSTLARQLKIWALNKRKPWFHLAFETAREFFPIAWFGVPKHKRPAPWIDHRFVARNRTVLQGYERRLKVLSPLPSFRENLDSLDALRRQIACSEIPGESAHQKRYPYLDRDLLEFIYAIPRIQLVRPGQRRSLMRRALTGIIPADTLNRSRKAYVARAPLTGISTKRSQLEKISREMVSNSLGIIAERSLRKILQQDELLEQVSLVLLFRTLNIELWLRNLQTFSRPGPQRQQKKTLLQRLAKADPSPPGATGYADLS